MNTVVGGLWKRERKWKECIEHTEETQGEWRMKGKKVGRRRERKWAGRRQEDLKEGGECGWNGGKFEERRRTLSLSLSLSLSLWREKGKEEYTAREGLVARVSE